jgi:multidrug resistance efflux pump
MNNGVRPVPTPARLRWREFRVQVVPWLVYVSMVVVVAFIWANHVTPSQMVGQVDIQQAHIGSTEAGRLVRLHVAPFDLVRNGDELAEVVVADPDVLEGNLAVIRAEIDLLRAENDPLISRERAQVDYSRLRLDFLDQRVQLASAQARLQFAEAEASRQAALRGQPVSVVAVRDFQRAENDRDALEAEIAERTQLIAAIEADLARFQIANPDAEQARPDGLLEAALALQESRLQLAEAELKPLPLTAPMDGVVSAVFRRAGENVLAGEALLTVTATQADRIHAFALPPWGEKPQVGMAVEVIRRSQRRERALAEVTHVGKHVDLIPPNLLAQTEPRGLGLNNATSQNAANRPMDLGLPLVISLPRELELLPGELVDLRWVSGGEPSVAVSN